MAARRGDPGEVIEALRGEYPYRYWLRDQRRRRGLPAGPTPAEAGIDCRCDPEDLFEPDASRLIGDALDSGARAVVFHEDTAGNTGTVRIVATPGPVSSHAGNGPEWAAVCRRGGAGEQGSDSTDAGIDWRHVERIDELLLHRSTDNRHVGGRDGPPGDRLPGAEPLVTPPPASRDIAVIVPSPASLALLERLFEGLVAEDRVAEVVVVDNSQPQRESDEFYRSWARRLPLVVEHTDPTAEFNYSRANNLGASASVSPLLAFCNDDLEFVAHPTLSRLAGWLDVPDVGVVGPTACATPMAPSSTAVWSWASTASPSMPSPAWRPDPTPSSATPTIRVMSQR